MTTINKNRFISPTRPIGAGKDKGLSIIVLSSSPGYRMKSYGPKCLIKDKYGVSILEHQTAIFVTEYPHCEIIVSGGFECDKIAKNKPGNTRLVENQRFSETNEIEDIRLALNNTLYESVLIVFGDIYFNNSIMQNLTKQESTIVVDKCGKMLEDDVGTTVVDDYLTIMSLSIESPKWAKIAYFTDKEAKLLRQFASNRDNSKLYLFEAINFILEKNGKFRTKQVHQNDFIVHIDSAKELEKI